MDSAPYPYSLDIESVAPGKVWVYYSFRTDSDLNYKIVLRFKDDSGYLYVVFDTE